MGVAPLHPLFGNGPQSFTKIDLGPGGVGQLTFAHHGEQQQLSRSSHRGGGADAVHVLVHQRDFVRAQSAVTGLEFSDACWTHQISRVLDFLATLNRPSEHLHHNLAGMHGRCWRSSLHDCIGQCSQILMVDFHQFLITELRFELTLVNRSAHVTGRVGHLIPT
ncbi:hypothetical protein D3C84_713820 [compost metagenome]